MTLSPREVVEAPAREWRRYPEYKDSGIEWLGEVPEHWRVQRLKYMLSRNDSGVWGDDGEEDGVVVLRSTDMTVDGGWSVNDPARRSLTQLEYRSARLQVGDLVVTKSSGSALHLGKTAFVTPNIEALNCCFSNFMQRLRAGEGADPKYLYWILNCPVGRLQLNYLGSTTTGLANLNGTVIGRVYSSCPEFEEQRSIAAFLNRETQKIDDLIAKRERLIGLLEEKRIALISRAVTKGLDPNVSMKDSRVGWIGEIPAHWEEKRLKSLTPDDRPIMYGIVLPGPNVEDGVPIVKGGDVAPGRLRLEVLNKTTREIESRYARSRLLGGDLVYAIRGSIGMVEIVPCEVEGANLTQDAARISPGPEIVDRWLLYALKSKTTFAQLDAGATGATIRGINIRDLKRAVVQVPPNAEQRDIAEYLDRQTRKMDLLVGKVREHIDKLHEYRTALISAAVTGKIDVRGEVYDSRGSL